MALDVPMSRVVLIKDRQRDRWVQLTLELVLFLHFIVIVLVFVVVVVVIFKVDRWRHGSFGLKHRRCHFDRNGNRRRHGRRCYDRSEFRSRCRCIDAELKVLVTDSLRDVVHSGDNRWR